MNISEILADPPRVHAGAPGGVWRSADACYGFLADVSAGKRTLETGCGISTAVFAAVGATHTCVVASDAEASICAAYLAEFGLPGVTFEVGPSDEVLPTGRFEQLDVMFIDGCHGFPTPILDWYYGARWLGPGGTLVLDDTNLPTLASLVVFLDADPRWTRTGGEETWAAYRRESEGGLGEDWEAQRFL